MARNSSSNLPLPVIVSLGKLEQMMMRKLAMFGLELRSLQTKSKHVLAYFAPLGQVSRLKSNQQNVRQARMLVTQSRVRVNGAVNR